MLQMKMISLILTVCVLLAIYDGTLVEAGRLKKLKELEEKLPNLKFERCCMKIRCYLPNVCYRTFALRLCGCLYEGEF